MIRVCMSRRLSSWKKLQFLSGLRDKEVDGQNKKIK